MINSKHYIKPAILHFKRWSNRSYAIFNSIGRVVHIGFLSTIIRDLVTVKSVLAYGLLNIINENFESDTCEEELLSQIELSDIDIISGLNTVSIGNANEGSRSEFLRILFYKNICKAIFGPFFIASMLKFGKEFTYGHL